MKKNNKLNKINEMATSGLFHCLGQFIIRKTSDYSNVRLFLLYLCLTKQRNQTQSRCVLLKKQDTLKENRKIKYWIRYFKLAFILCSILFLINLILRKYDIRLSHNMLDVFSIIFYISATILFLHNLKLKKYFRASFFFIFPIFLILNVVSNKLIENFFAVVHLNPILQNNVKYNDKNLVIYYEMNISLNQKYDIYEKKYLIFEKKIDEIIMTDSIKPYLKITNQNKRYTIKYPRKVWNRESNIYNYQLIETFKIINL